LVVYSLRYKKCEGEVLQQLVELHEHEREIRREQGGQLTTLQDQFDHISNGNSDVLTTGVTPGGKLAVAEMEKVDIQEKLQESNSSHEQVVPISQFVSFDMAYL
jgi:hypothetical protein